MNGNAAIFLILCFLGAAAIVALIIYSAIQEDNRRMEMMSFARSLKLSFNPEKQYGFSKRYAQFKFLKQGYNRYASNIISGRWRGYFVYIFDYHWSESNGNYGSEHRKATFIMLKPYFSMRPFQMRPEGLLDRLADFFGSEDIDFESAEFSSNFVVTSPDRRWTFDFFHNRMIEYVMKNGIQNIICDGDMIAANWNNKQLYPMQIEKNLARLTGLLNQMPSHLRRRDAA